MIKAIRFVAGGFLMAGVFSLYTIYRVAHVNYYVGKHADNDVISLLSSLADWERVSWLEYAIYACGASLAFVASIGLFLSKSWGRLSAEAFCWGGVSIAINNAVYVVATQHGIWHPPGLPSIDWLGVVFLVVGVGMNLFLVILFAVALYALRGPIRTLLPTNDDEPA